MSKENQTPKSWRVVKRSNQTGIKTLAVDTNTQQGGIWQIKGPSVLTHQNLEHAKVIAASPELLKAALLLDVAYSESEEFPAYGITRKQLTEAWSSLRAAIQKATGECK